MQTSPLVSIGIAAYNRPDGLRKALQSVTSQTYQNLEIVVSDDCSPNPEVSRVALEAMQTEPRIKFHRQEINLGVIPNFEFLLNQATGKYFFWADDEDLCDAEFVERLVECLEENPDMAVCGCDVKIIDQHDRLIKTQKLAAIRPEADWKKARRLFFRYPTFNIYLCVLGIYRTELLKKANIWNLVGWKGIGTHGEVPFLAQLATLGRIAAIPAELKTYRFNPESVYHREMATVPWHDWFMLRLTIRLRLCRIALASQEAPIEKFIMIYTVLRSFVISAIRSPLGRVRRWLLQPQTR